MFQGSEVVGEEFFVLFHDFAEGEVGGEKGEVLLPAAALPLHLELDVLVEELETVDLLFAGDGHESVADYAAGGVSA